MIGRGLLLLAAGLAAGCTAPVPGARTADAARGHALAQARCAACHSIDGSAQPDGVPQLGEQFPEYLVKQLNAFAAPADAPNHRENAVMRPIAQALSDSDKADLAAFYSAMWRTPSKPRDAARVAAGRELYLHGSPADGLPACASCHRPTGLGIRPDFPNLASQNPAYVEHQLAVWEATRGHPGKLMSLIAPRIRPEQRPLLADYVATLPSRPVPEEAGR